MASISITLRELHRVMDYLELTRQQRKRLLKLCEKWENVYE